MARFHTHSKRRHLAIMSYLHSSTNMGELINLLSMFVKIVLTINFHFIFSESPNEFIPSYSGMITTQFNSASDHRKNICVHAVQSKLCMLCIPRYSTTDHWIQESIKRIFNSGLFWAAAEKKQCMLLLRSVFFMFSWPKKLKFNSI